MLRALGGTVISYRDGDYSFGLHWERNDEMATWWMRTTRWARCCASSGWTWCSASCCWTRWCRTRPWR
jgi:hypothetical protein